MPKLLTAQWVEKFGINKLWLALAYMGFREWEELMPDGEVAISDVYSYYVEWCEGQGIPIMSKIIFGINLKKVRLSLKTRYIGTAPNRYRIYLGIGLP